MVIMMNGDGDNDDGDNDDGDYGGGDDINYVYELLWSNLNNNKDTNNFINIKITH